MPSERVQRQSDALLDSVESAINDADWDGALGSIRAVLTANPEAYCPYRGIDDGWNAATTLRLMASPPHVGNPEPTV